MFRGAVKADLEAVLALYEQGRARMRENGNPTQWGDNYPPKALVERDIEANRLFVYMDNGRLVGAFVLLFGGDACYDEIDGRWLNDAPYGAVHRVVADAASHGIAEKILEWCGERCQNLRIDTHKENKVMQHILEKNGFSRCGIVHVEDGSPRVAYQKVLLETVGAAAKLV